MSINKKELFERTRALWPNVVDLARVPEDSGLSDVAQVLNDLYYRIEATIDENDHWMQVAIWAYYQSIPEHSAVKDSKIYPKDVDFVSFDRMMIENLKGDDCWKHERNIYLESENS